MISWLPRLIPSLNADTLIEQLIEKKGCQTYRPGMAKPDSIILSRIGQRKWAETLVAQRRLYKMDKPKLLLFKAGAK